MNTDAADDADPTSEVYSKVCTLITRIYNDSHKGMGSDGSGGSVNGELGNKACYMFSKKLQLSPEDVFLDAGSGSGLTVCRIQALANCRASIGVETEVIRHNIAQNFNLRLMTSLSNLDIRVGFDHSNICTFQTFNGVTKLFMYDAVFVESDMFSIAKIFNKTSTIEYLIATNGNLFADFGFQVELVEKLGNFMAKGCQMSHSFYLYKSLLHGNSTVNLDTRIESMINLASNKISRLQLVTNYVKDFHASNKPSRTLNINKKIVDDSPDHKLFLLPCEKYPIINNIRYEQAPLSTSLRSSRSLTLFNEQQSSIVGRKSFGGISNKLVEKSLIVPSSDGKSDGKVLIDLYQNLVGGRTKYYGVVYDIAAKQCLPTELYTNLFGIFDSDAPIGINHARILRVRKAFVYFRLLLSDIFLY
jgi:hypothetical protein